MKIFAYDPVLSRIAGNRITIDVANEHLGRGPRGKKVEVIDYDSTNSTFYPPVDLDDPAILMSGGIDPAEGDHQFHQQMVYAVAMKVVENAERALGREIRFRGGPLKIFPHAFRGANAFYDHSSRSLFFGYFRADEANPGANLPRQWVFTCLSHDIIAHETTHAIVDKIRYRYRFPTNRDVLAFHEAIADIVAIFQHFTFPEVLGDAIRTTRTDLRSPSALVDLAVQFGHGTGKGGALRTALDGKPDQSAYATTFAPHRLGSVLVAAVFDGFFTLYQSRIEALLRLATGGTGVLPEGALHPDLVNRAAHEANVAADEILTACLRAFDYLPVLDVDFGDFLRALVTADHELNPDDSYGRRAALIEAFRRRGIYPSGVTSLGEDALLWDPDLATAVGLPKLPDEVLSLVIPELVAYDRRTETLPEDWGDVGEESQKRSSRDEGRRAVYDSLYRFGSNNASKLFLAGNDVSVAGFNPTFRVGEDGKLRTEIVVQWVDTMRTAEDLGGLKPSAGTTVVFSADGAPRYIVPKPWPHENLEGEMVQVAGQRKERMLGFVDECDARDPAAAWSGDADWGKRMLTRFALASVHKAPGYLA